MKTLRFSKYSGNGNDFIILDNPSFVPTSEQIIHMCSRHFGIGADGVLLATDIPHHDTEMRIFNSDGGEAEMCGNGIRCLAAYLADSRKEIRNSYSIKTMNASYEVIRRHDSFAIEMSEIKDTGVYDLSSFEEFEKRFFVNTGVPHLVFLTKNTKAIDIKKIAPVYRFHKTFPNGTNVSFLEVLPEEQSAYVRTFERGVEDETYSCGTGLTASGLALSSWFGWKGLITLHTLGGVQKVEIGHKVYYSGEVKHCFSGEIEL